MYARLIRVMVAIGSSMLVTSPTMSIVNGEPDAGRHPNVGVIAYGIQNNQTINPLCSGTLIAPDVFLSAAHCIPVLDRYRELGVLSGVWITFDEVYGPDPVHPDRSNWIPVSAWHAPPGIFDAGGQLLFNDIAVHILDLTNKPAHVVMPEPAALPVAGLLDDLAAHGGLQGETFTPVGYGISRTFFPLPPSDQFQLDPLDRSVAASEFRALAPDLVYISQNPALDDGGICYGDSGGPFFFQVGAGDLVVAIASSADTNCRAWGNGFRTDTETARSFLQQFVSLP